MKVFLRILKWVAIVLIVLLIAIQLVRPARTNPSVDQAQTLEAQTQMSAEVAAILDRSCRDCHSNKTVWPWYSHTAPVSWWVIDHVNHGRSHLNYSEWGKLDRDKKDRRLREICDEVMENRMPLPSYLPMHASAKLSESDKKALCDWTEKERQRLAK